MERFAALYDAIDGRPRPTPRSPPWSAYFQTAPPADAAWAVFFLTGRRLKRLVSFRGNPRLDARRHGLDEWLLDECYAVVGDGAETAALVLDQVGGRDLRRPHITLRVGRASDSSAP